MKTDDKETLPVMKRFFSILILFFFGHGVAQAEAATHALDIRLGDHSARFIYATEISSGSLGQSNMDFGVYFNDDNDSLYHIGFFVQSESLDYPFTINLGTRAYYGDTGNGTGQVQTDMAAIAIGGELIFAPRNFAGFGFAANYYVAPGVVSFMDIDKFVEYGARVEFSFTEAARLFVGYRNIEVDREDGINIEVESGLMFGIGLRF